VIAACGKTITILIELQGDVHAVDRGPFDLERCVEVETVVHDEKASVPWRAVRIDRLEDELVRAAPLTWGECAVDRRGAARRQLRGFRSSIADLDIRVLAKPRNVRVHAGRTEADGKEVADDVAGREAEILRVAAIERMRDLVDGID